MRLPQERLGCGVIRFFLENQSEIIQADGRRGMVRAKDFLLNGQGPASERLRVGAAPNWR